MRTTSAKAPARSQIENSNREHEIFKGKSDGLELWPYTLIGTRSDSGIIWNFQNFEKNRFQDKFCHFVKRARPIYGKVFQDNGCLFSFVQIRDMSKTDFWKTHPIIDFWILGPENWNFEIILDKFSKNPSVSHYEKMKFWKKFWTIFPRNILIGQCDVIVKWGLEFWMIYLRNDTVEFNLYWLR